MLTDDNVCELLAASNMLQVSEGRYPQSHFIEINCNEWDLHLFNRESFISKNKNISMDIVIYLKEMS